VLLTTISLSLYANPSGENTVAGSADFSRSGSTLQITTSDRVIIDWQDFSINSGELTKFLQPSSTSAALNRVVSGNPSSILGDLQANGQIYLINPNGILVGSNARIDTSSFIASTLDLKDSDFMKGGDLEFIGSSQSSIQNFGSIKALGGDVYLFGQQVENSGSISAPNGTVGLASGQNIILSQIGSEHVFVKPSATAIKKDTGILNRGTIDGSQVELKADGNMYAYAINNEGVLRVNDVQQINGRIILTADGGTILSDGQLSATTIDGNGIQNGGTINVAGKAIGLGGIISANGNTGGSITVNGERLSLAGDISANGSKQGGNVQLTATKSTIETSSSRIDVSGGNGGNITHFAGEGILSSGNYSALGFDGVGGNISLSASEMTLLSANLNASGSKGGGTILIGGEDQGGKNLAMHTVPNAKVLEVSSGTRVKADSTGDSGDGGHIVFWSDESTKIFADVSAVPGLTSGNGGSVEISSGGDLLFGANVQTGTGNRQGSLLLDPKNIIIAEPNVSQYSLVLGVNFQTIAGFNTLLEAGDHFGVSLSLDGTRLAVGTASDAGFGNTTADAGAVYLFSFSDNAFSNPIFEGIIGKGYTGGKNLNMSGLETGDSFGRGVSLNGNRLAIGANSDDGFGNGTADSGAVYLLTFSDSKFTTPTLASTIGNGYVGGKNFNLALTSGDAFGEGVSLDGNRLAVGAPGDQGSGGGTGASTGAVYLFSFSDSIFSSPNLEATMGSGYAGGKNVDVTSLEAGDNFGSRVSLQGTQLVIGSAYDAGFGNSTAGAGAAYLYTFSDQSFNNAALRGIIGKGYTGGNNFNVSTLDVNDTFGSVSLYGNRLAIGAIGDDGSNNGSTDVGAVYLFSFADNQFSSPTLEGIVGKGYTGGKNVDMGNALTAGDFFGHGVSLNDNHLAIGAPWPDSVVQTPLHSGAAYLFSWGDSVSSVLFATDSALNYTLSPRVIAGLLASGQNITLQANNDITINSEITVSNPTGNGGNLTLQAGRSIFVNAGITTDNGDLTLIANEKFNLSSGVVLGQRDDGPASITLGSGANFNVGTGKLTLLVQAEQYGIGGESTVADFTSSSTPYQSQEPVVNIPLTSFEPPTINVGQTPTTSDDSTTSIPVSSSSGDIVSDSSFNTGGSLSTGTTTDASDGSSDGDGSDQDKDKKDKTHTNRSGGGDGTNPGGHGNDAGFDNPGGSKK
jgi:filamentous hemagglutinin family protein